MKRITILVVAAAACTGQSDADVASTPADSTESVVPDFVTFVDSSELPTMPGYPAARSGMLQVVSAGDTDLSRSIAATASVCTTPSMLILSAGGGDDSWGYILLMQLPESDREVVYPLAHVDRGFPVPPASAIGVERVSGDAGSAYQGLQGFAEVTDFSETLSGRFQITVRQIITEEYVQLAGSFSDIEIHQRTAEECLPAAAIN